MKLFISILTVLIVYATAQPIIYIQPCVDRTTNESCIGHCTCYWLEDSNTCIQTNSTYVNNTENCKGERIFLIVVLAIFALLCVGGICFIVGVTIKYAF